MKKFLFPIIAVAMATAASAQCPVNNCQRTSVCEDSTCVCQAANCGDSIAVCLRAKSLKKPVRPIRARGLVTKSEKRINLADSLRARNLKCPAKADPRFKGRHHGRHGRHNACCGTPCDTTNCQAPRRCNERKCMK